MTEKFLGLIDPTRVHVHTLKILLVFLSVLLVCGAWRVRITGELKDFGKDETLPLRALLAMLVVAGHLDKGTKFMFPLLGVVHWSTPAVAVFFFMSGFGLRKVYESQVASGRLGAYLRHFPRRTLARLLPPFLVLGPAFAVWRCAVGQISMSTLAEKALTLSILDIPHDWYVIALVILYAIFAISALCFKGNKVAISIWLLSAVFWCVVCLIFADANPRKDAWHVSLFLFPIGFSFAQCERQIRAAFLSHPFRVALSVVAAATCCYSLRKISGVPYIKTIREPFLCMIGPMCALVLYAFDELKRVKPLCYLGLFSYEIYLVHGIGERVFKHVGLSGLPYALSVVAFALPAAWLLWKFDAFATKLIGGESRRNGGAATIVAKKGAE